MFESLRTWCRRLAAQAYTPPFAAILPSNARTFVAVEPARKIFWRRIRRGLWLRLNGQAALEQRRIRPSDRRILWIHQGMPQIGDSLMDLACRVLLRGCAERIDLLTDAHLVPLYENDDVFTHAWQFAREAAGHDYDLVIVLSASAQSLREKLRFFRALPYVNLHGFYTGPEFNRTLFGFLRLDQLLDAGIGAANLAAMARPHMVVSQAVRHSVDALSLPPRFVAIALGGVRDWRTYDAWSAVLDALDRVGNDVPVVLLGSANASAMRDALFAHPHRRVVVDAVDRHSLPEVFEILRRSSVVACADGGLMHLAQAADAPTVALFADRIDPSYRLTAAIRAIAFHAPARVSDIAPSLVAEAIDEALRHGVIGMTVRRV